MITKYMLFGDVHFESKNEKNLDLVLQAAESCDVDCIIANGDLVNFSGVSRHGKVHPEKVDAFKDEIEEVREWLEKLRERFPNKRIQWNFGNHFQWAEKYILENAPVLLNLFSLPKYFRLDELNIEYYDYNVPVQIENTDLWVRHSPHSYAEGGALTSLKKCMDRSYITNCTHRTQSAHLGTAGGDVRSYYFVGHLADTSTSEFSYTKGNAHNWTSSCAMITVLDGKEFHVEQSLIKNNTLFIDGKTFIGE